MKFFSGKCCLFGISVYIRGVKGRGAKPATRQGANDRGEAELNEQPTEIGTRHANRGDAIGGRRAKAIKFLH